MGFILGALGVGYPLCSYIVSCLGRLVCRVRAYALLYVILYLSGCLHCTLVVADPLHSYVLCCLGCFLRCVGAYALLRVPIYQSGCLHYTLTVVKPRVFVQCPAGKGCDYDCVASLVYH